MKKIMLTALLIVGVSAWGSALAATAMPQPADVRAALNQGGGENFRKTQLGTQIVDKKVQVLRATYDLSTEASTGTIILKDVDGKDATLPDNAIITQVLIDAIIDPTSSGSPTIALGANTTTDLLGATAIASYTGILAGIPVDTAATAVKTTARRNIVATIAASSLEAGKFHVFIEYYVSED